MSTPRKIASQPFDRSNKSSQKSSIDLFDRAYQLQSPHGPIKLAQIKNGLVSKIKRLLTLIDHLPTELKSQDEIKQLKQEINTIHSNPKSEEEITNAIRQICACQNKYDGIIKIKEIETLKQNLSTRYLSLYNDFVILFKSSIINDIKPMIIHIRSIAKGLNSLTINTSNYEMLKIALTKYEKEYEKNKNNYIELKKKNETLKQDFPDLYRIYAKKVRLLDQLTDLYKEITKLSSPHSFNTEHLYNTISKLETLHITVDNDEVFKACLKHYKNEYKIYSKNYHQSIFSVSHTSDLGQCGESESAKSQDQTKIYQSK